MAQARRDVGSAAVVFGLGLGFGLGNGLRFGFRLGIGISVVVPVLGVVGIGGREEGRWEVLVVTVVVVVFGFGAGLGFGLGFSLGLGNGDVLGEVDVSEVDLESPAPDGKPLQVGGLQVLGKGQLDVFL